MKHTATKLSAAALTSIAIAALWSISFTNSVAAQEVVLRRGALRVVAHEIKLKSERLHYEVDVSYPQIVGRNEPHLQKLNAHLKALAISRYQWVLHPSKKDLRYNREQFPGGFNDAFLRYEITLATDHVLSVAFGGYNDAFIAAHAVHYSFAVTYDLDQRTELRLADLFKRHSHYLQFMSAFCLRELSDPYTNVFQDALTPVSKNFESWTITSEGLSFDFDPCKSLGCSDIVHTVTIPLVKLKRYLTPKALAYFRATLRKQHANALSD